MAQKTERKKVNFMVDSKVLTILNEFVPAGMRSDFVNEALNAGLTKFKKKKAAKGIAGIKIKMNDEEIIELKNHGR